MKDLTDETKMLNVAAAEQKLLRTAIQDCVTILEQIKTRDCFLQSGRALRWQPGEPASVALSHAKQLLSPRPDLRPLKQKEAA